MQVGVGRVAEGRGRRCWRRGSGCGGGGGGGGGWHDGLDVCRCTMAGACFRGSDPPEDG